MAKRKRKNRAHRIAALVDCQKAEHERERDVGRESHQAPAAFQIPTKLVRVGRDLELRADFQDEWFGGFRPTKPDAPGSPYNRIWGRGDISVERFGRTVAWQRTPQGWAAAPPNEPWPFILRAELEARGKDLAGQRECDPERDRADELARLDEYEWSLGQPHGADKRRYAHGVRWMERETTLAEHYERRIQRHTTNWYKPSRRLELKRLPKLPKVEPKLFPKEPPGRMLGFGSELEFRNALRADLLVRGGVITQCPPEMTTAMANKRPVGRPPIGDRKMTNAEKQKRYYDRKRGKLRMLLEAPPTAPTGEQPHVPTDSKRNQHNIESVDEGVADATEPKAD